ncbi:hypothetical protein T492DRAFT_833527 [Pavlovales sp. CCMP2436]|nr:hypothetical protein T492DRAFT_833527 [Pavlovales sp. CCMP2436]
MAPLISDADGPLRPPDGTLAVAQYLERQTRSARAPLSHRPPLPCLPGRKIGAKFGERSEQPHIELEPMETDAGHTAEPVTEPPAPAFAPVEAGLLAADGAPNGRAAADAVASAANGHAANAAATADGRADGAAPRRGRGKSVDYRSLSGANNLPHNYDPGDFMDHEPQAFKEPHRAQPRPKKPRLSAVADERLVGEANGAFALASQVAAQPQPAAAPRAPALPAALAVPEFILAAAEGMQLDETNLHVCRMLAELGKPPAAALALRAADPKKVPGDEELAPITSAAGEEVRAF